MKQPKFNPSWDVVRIYVSLSVWDVDADPEPTIVFEARGGGFMSAVAFPFAWYTEHVAGDADVLAAILERLDVAFRIEGRK